MKLGRKVTQVTLDRQDLKAILEIQVQQLKPEQPVQRETPARKEIPEKQVQKVIPAILVRKGIPEMTGKVSTYIKTQHIGR